MGMAMSGVRSSNPSIPAVTGTFDPSLLRSRYRDWSSAGARSYQGTSEWPRRVLHFLLALIAIIITLPVMFLIAVLVRLTSKGPVLYTQIRVGHDRRVPLAGSLNHRRERDLGGRPFTIYKFRTMWVDAEHA